MAETKWEKWQVIEASPLTHKISNCIITSEKEEFLYIAIPQECQYTLTSVLIEALNVAILAVSDEREKFWEIVPKGCKR